MSYPIGTRCLIIGSVQRPEVVGKECVTCSKLLTGKALVGSEIKVVDYYQVQVSGEAHESYSWAEHLMKIDPDQDFSGDEEEDNLDRIREKVTVGVD